VLYKKVSDASRVQYTHTHTHTHTHTMILLALFLERFVSEMTYDCAMWDVVKLHPLTYYSPAAHSAIFCFFESRLASQSVADKNDGVYHVTVPSTTQG